MDQRPAATVRRLTTSLLLGTCLSPAPLWAADFIVSTNADSGAGSLRQAIINSNSAGGSNNIIINSGVGTITLTSADLPTIANNATIVGNGNTLSGGNTFRGLLVGGFSGTTQTTVSVSVSDLTIANARAQGGNASSAPGIGSGGGGAGLGGALFVAKNATLTVSNVNLTSNSAVGGAGGQSAAAGGGGGGMGGNGGTTLGGGGGLGVGSTGGNNAAAGSAGVATGGSAGGTGGSGGGGGTAGGASGGGGGGATTGGGGGSAAGGGVGGANGVNGGSGTLNGGTGGFGGGGGAGTGAGSVGGAGGFGGGGGGGGLSGGTGGFGGGNGGGAGIAGGGGGAGLGGAVFVQQGGTFNIAGAFNVSGGTVTAGASGGGAGGATAGSAFGAGIFLQGNGTVNFAPGAGVIQTMSNAIADQTGSGGTGANAGSWTLAKSGPGTLVLQTANTYSGGTTVTGGLINFAAANNFGSGQVTLNGGGLQWATGTTTDISGQLASLASGGATFDTNGNNVTFANALSGTGGLTKAGLGTLTLSGANTYSGATTINAGTLQLASGASLASALTINAGTFAISGNASVGNLSGTGGAINLASGILTVNSSANATLGSTISGAGGLTKAGSGTLSLTGADTYTGATTVSAGTLAVNGSITSNVTVGSGATLGGTGTIVGNVVTAGNLAPGNSIGTLNVSGNYTQSAGSTYTVEVNAAGQSDKVNVTGTTAINGGTVSVQAQSGSYARNTTYTILTANGGVSGTYANVTSNFAFLTPSLAYDANNVYLSLFMNQSAFAAGAQTLNQYAVGTVLDQNWVSSTGDFATVLSAMSVLSTTAGPAALDAISGQQYADFGTTNVANASLFMNTLGQQMANARSGSAAGARVALAQACEVEACDDTVRLSAWFSGLGGLGSVQGNGNSSTLTYNVGGAAAGLDYRVTPNVLLGLGVGYTHGTQWVNSFMGQGWTDSVSVAACGSFTQAGFYADALAGYAYLGNQMQRQILIPGLQQRTASGSTSANQFLAQLETGYKLGVWDALAVTPFGRFQTSITTQNAFTESGANSLNLSVAQQTTNSVRTVLGAELGSTIPLGAERSLSWNVRLGWQHEYASTARPISASFGGAPSSSFTVYGATPTRDAAIVGFSATTSVAAATQLYLRYDGELGSGTDNHALSAGLRMSW